MTGKPPPSLLARKIAAVRPRADPATMSVARAVERAFALGIERLARMPVRMIDLTEALRSGDEIVDTLPDLALIALTQGPREAAGLVILDPDALACLIEMLTMGRLMGRAPPPRRPTRTDAAMVAGLLDLVLAEMETALAEADGAIWAGGFRYGAHLPDPRPLGLMLDERAYRTIRCRLGFGPPAAEGAGRGGEVTLIFPAEGRGARRTPERPAAAEGAVAPPAGDADWDDRLGRALAGAPVTLDAVLARVSLPLSALLSLAPGMSVAFPTSALQSVQLEGADGGLVCLARLGQGGGRRALRLDLPAAEGAEPALPLPVLAGDVWPAHAPPVARPLPAIPDVAAEAAVAAVRAAEAEADRLMQERMNEAARAG